jgi:hypothetical protein
MLQHSATTSVPDELPKDNKENQRRAPYPFTQLPNALYALMPSFDGSKVKVLWVILRYTFGFQSHVRPAAIGLSMFQKETGLTRETVSNALNSLVSQGIVERYGEGTQRRSYRVVIPGPTLVGKSDQPLVKQSDRALVGNSDHTKESSSKTPVKKNSVNRSEFRRSKDQNQGVNARRRTVFPGDDDGAARSSTASVLLSPEEELKGIVREKTGEPMRALDLRRIKEILELRCVALDSFVREVQLHRNGRWRNPIGLLFYLAKTFHWRVQVATSPLEISKDDPTRKCGCSWGLVQRNPDVFCDSCELGRELSKQAKRDEKRKVAAPSASSVA